ncbi:MAG: type VI secretion system baseplate subunit TssF [Rhodocyclaceae bacterium]|nr:type VI secretion system baseplate subunit TssF [Rhodocyclaceae bacterium]
MDPRLLRYYNQELQHLREMGAEFAREFPKIAGRLGMDGIEVSDPYVERLLEGVAFMSARVQLRLDSEFPRFSQRLLEMVYPQYLAPTPAMLVAQLKPQMDEANLADGVTLERGTVLQANAGKVDATPCQFTTAQDLVLWPLDLVEAKYFSFAPDLPLNALPVGSRIKGGVRLRLRTAPGIKLSELATDSLQIHIGGADEVAYKLYELIGANVVGAMTCPCRRPVDWHEFIPPESIQPVGFDDDEALLPVTARNFGGYRLLQEYFAFPQRYLFFQVDGLARSFRRCDDNEMDLVLLFGKSDTVLESVVDASNFLLHCVPAINLFRKRTDRIRITDSTHEHHVIADRTRPMDYEIFDLVDVTGFGVGADSEQRFEAFYASYHASRGNPSAYYTFRREPRIYSERQKRFGPRTSYIGSEVFLSLVDPKEAPYKADLRQLSLQALCTNRDLPLIMPHGSGATDFSLEVAAPVVSIHCVKGPSRPYSSVANGAAAWRFISHLSLNYLSLLDSNPAEGAAALRELLELHSPTEDVASARQIEGVRKIHAEPVLKRLPMPGPLCFGRGIGITLELDEMNFEGGSAFLLGSVLERFFARHVSVNSFTETTLRSLGRGELMRWKPRCGLRPIF